MPNPLFWLVTAVVLPQAERMLDRLVRSPHFYRGVQQIHRRVEDFKYGRDPNDPLKQGEATRDQTTQRSSFFKYFTEELKNQLRGEPTEDFPPNKSSKTKR